VQVTFIVIDHEIISTVICTVTQLWYVRELSVPCERENIYPVAELCCDEFNVAYWCDPEVKYEQHIYNAQRFARFLIKIKTKYVMKPYHNG
jgi:hypothetical protein